MRINAYLIKDGFRQRWRHEMAGDRIIEHKDSVFDVDVCLVGEPRIEAHIRTLQLPAKLVTRAASAEELYFRNRDPYEPAWRDFWGVSDNVTVRTADAIALVECEGRLFALCHGHSSHLLNPYAIEPNFGLRTAINLVDGSLVNSADLFTPSETAFQTRKKTSRGAKFGEYDINVLNTLLKNISGRVHARYARLFRTVDGADSLRFSHSGTPQSLTDVLREASAAHKRDDYKTKGFDFIDNFAVERDPAVVAGLDAELVSRINTRQVEIELFLPSALDQPSNTCFRFTGLGPRTKNVFDRLDPAKTLYDVLRRSGKEFRSAEELKEPGVAVVDYDNPGVELVRHPIYRCLYAEVAGESSMHFIEGGVWYRVDASFLRAVDATVADLLDHPLLVEMDFSRTTLHARYHRKGQAVSSYENWYNTELAGHLRSSGLPAECLDGRLVVLGARDRVEVCDVLFVDAKRQRYLMHNKCTSGSSALSHLFSQGNVSAELLTRPDFRRLANAEIRARELKLPTGAKFDARGYTVLYGIAVKPGGNGALRLPVFSRINLRVFVDSLRSKSYRVQVGLIREV